MDSHVNTGNEWQLTLDVKRTLLTKENKRHKKQCQESNNKVKNIKKNSSNGEKIKEKLLLKQSVGAKWRWQPDGDMSAG